MTLPEGLRILVVVVVIVHIGDHMAVAGGVDTGAAGIIVLGGLPNGPQDPLVLQVVGLVEGTPADDGRMIYIPLDDLHPLRQEVGQTLGTGDIQAPTGMFAPDQVTQLVRPVQEPLLKYFLVETGAVKTYGHGQLDVGLQRLVAGSGVDTVGVETLVQHGPLEHGLAVDQELVAHDLNGPEAEVAACPIDYVTVLLQGEGHIVQHGLARFPKLRFGNIGDEAGESRRGAGAGTADDPVILQQVTKSDFQIVCYHDPNVFSKLPKIVRSYIIYTTKIVPER